MRAHTTGVRRAMLLPAAILTAALLVPASAEARSSIRLAGKVQTVPICGKARKARVVTTGTRLVAKLRVNGKRPRRSARVKISRCQNGRFVTISNRRARSQKRLPTGKSADLRITWRKRTSYVRVAAAPARQAPAPAVTRVPVSFRVINQNRAPSPCPVDNKPYTIRGHITAPTALLESGANKNATLYLHGLSLDESLWTYTGVPGYDFTGELAKRGHVSVTYDRLGYEKSDKPNGNQLCYTSEADMASQIIDQLKSGGYQLEGRRAVPRFGRVALAGSSQGALVAEGAASTFDNIDALLHIGFAPAAFVTPSIGAKFAVQIAECGTTSMPAEQTPGNPPGYQFRGRTEKDYIETNFFNADPALVADFTKRRNIDTCGYPLFVGPWIAYASANDATIKVPVLTVFGAKDANFFPQSLAADGQRALFSGSSDVTSELLPDTGHMMPLERSAPRLQGIVSNWLERRGF